MAQKKRNEGKEGSTPPEPIKASEIANMSDSPVELYRLKKSKAITEDVVRNVSLHVARGIPLAMACMAEGVKEKSFRSALHRKPALAELYHVGKAQWMAQAVERLDSGAKYISGLVFLLERRHSNLFRRPKENQQEGLPPGALVLVGPEAEAVRKLAASDLAKPVKIVETEPVTGSQPAKNEEKPQ